jgi:hypothetical protein
MKIKTSIKFTTIALATTFGLALAAAAADTAPLPPASTKTGVTYATDIKPIFDQSCVKCHSGDKPKAKLKLDSLENALKGSKDGKVITAGDSANSLIVNASRTQPPTTIPGCRQPTTRQTSGRSHPNKSA